MEPSKDPGGPEDRRPFDEIEPTDNNGQVGSEPQEHPKSLEDNVAMEDKTPIDNLEQREDTVLSGVAPSEDIEPSSSDAPAMLVPPSKDERQSAAAHENLTEFEGKAGAYVYKPGTSTLVFRPGKQGESLNGETLLKAVLLGQTKHVEYLLNAKVSTEFKDNDDRTPLLCAVEENNIDIVELLLRSKADWNARNKSKRTVLHIASSNGSNGIVLKFLSIPELDLDAQDEQFETPLHLAVRSGHQMAVKFLLEFGANVNAKDKKGFTPLHLAAAKRGPTLVKMILGSKDVQVDVRANNGRTPLMQACERVPSPECEEVVKLLLDKEADPAACDHNGETPIFLSAWVGNRGNLANLISWKRRPIDINALTEDNRSALFGPARFGFTTIAQLLLDAGINSMVKNDDGRTALLESAKYDKIEVMRLILESLVTKYGQERKKLVQPALFEAAVQDSSQVARFLIEQGASMDEKEPASQKTAMEIANDHSSRKVIAVLLEKGDQLVSQGPSLGDRLQEAPAEAEFKKVVLEDSAVDLTFGFQSTIASFPYDTRKKYRIKRPQLRSLLYDHSPEPIRYGLKEAESTSKNFRWLHVPSNNIVWVNKLISRMYKECHPPEKASYFQEKCKHLFGEEVWTRHQYQMSHTSVAHRRFIRPICQRIALSDTDDNMMMVLPYIHWETNSGRNQMTDVIVEAMKRHLKDPQPLSTSKGLNEALEELEKIRNSKFMDPDDDATSGYASDYSYYDSYTRTSSVSNDGRTRWLRGKVTKETEPPADPDVDWISRVALETLENEVIRARHAPVEKKAEQEERRKKRIQKIVKVAKESRRSDEKLILAYMFDEIPLHFRRTLDQYYYYTLPTTEARDSDQVVSRYFEKTWPEEENENLVLMVDQLWLWILDNDTIVTSFPQRWNKSEEKSEKDPDPNNDSDIVESIIRQIGKQDRRPLTNVFDLAELIVSKCVGTMFEHPDIANEKLRFAEFFEISIGNVTNEESKMFNDFTDLFERLAKDDQNISTSDELKKDLRKLFEISEETKLVKEIKDIRDELHIISTILEDQETVLVDMEEAIQAMKARKTEGVEQKKLQTASSYHSLPERVRMHKAVVQGLDKQAEKTYVALKDLLDLKQKQANVSEARTQGKQAAETARQGQTLMLFTVITVFFLPMSFMSSFFSLDIAEFVRNSDGALSLGYVSEIMFTVTVAVVIISLSFAFRWELFVVFITYCKDLLRSFREGLKKFLKSVQKISTRRRERINVIEEVNKPSSDSDEVVVIEETSPPRRRLRSREYRRGRPSRYSPSPARLKFGRGRDISGLFALFGLWLGTRNVDVVERYSRRRSASPRTPTGWFGGRQRQRTETVVVEERYGRRGSSSVWGWYGNDDRRSAPKRKKWPPWAWFEKSLAPTRRSRRIHFRDESGQTGLKGLYASFITPLLGWFGISQRAPESRTSVTSSYFSYDGSASSHDRGSNGSSDARSR